MQTSHIDRAFAKMPKMIKVPYVNNFINQAAVYPQAQYGQQFYADPYQQQSFQQQPYGMAYPQQQQNQLSNYQPTYQQSESQAPSEHGQNDGYRAFAEEYMKYYVDYWNNYNNEMMRQQELSGERSEDDLSNYSLNDRVSGEDLLGKNSKKSKKIKHEIKEHSNEHSQSASQHGGVLEMNKLKDAIQERADIQEGDSQLSIDSDLLREEFRQQEEEEIIDEDDLIPEDQDFLFEESIDGDEFEEYIPECRVDPARKVLEFIEEEKRIEKEKAEQLKREQEEKEREAELQRQEEERQMLENEQFYENNPEVYLEHRKKQKKMIFTALKLEMDKLLKKMQNVEEDLFEAQDGIDKCRKETDSHNLKTKKLEFYLRAKKIQRDIDNVILENKEEDLVETNFELLKGLHESILDDQLERMYETNQHLFLQISQALQESISAKKPRTFKNFQYYDNLKQNVKFDMAKERQEFFKSKVLPRQKSLHKNTLPLPKKRSDSKNKNPEKPLHKKAWNQQ